MAHINASQAAASKGDTANANMHEINAAHHSLQVTKHDKAAMVENVWSDAAREAAAATRKARGASTAAAEHGGPRAVQASVQADKLSRDQDHATAAKAHGQIRDFHAQQANKAVKAGDYDKAQAHLNAAKGHDDASKSHAVAAKDAASPGKSHKEMADFHEKEAIKAEKSGDMDKATKHMKAQQYHEATAKAEKSAPAKASSASKPAPVKGGKQPPTREALKQIADQGRKSQGKTEGSRQARTDHLMAAKGHADKAVAAKTAGNARLASKHTEATQFHKRKAGVTNRSLVNV